MIEYKVRRLKPEYSPSGKVYYGTYHGSSFWDVKGYAINKWMVVFNIDVDYEKYMINDYSIEEIANYCLEDMSKIPKRKKFQRRLKNPPYGILSLYRVKPKKDKDGPYLQIMATTNIKKSRRLCRLGEGLI